MLLLEELCFPPHEEIKWLMKYCNNVDYEILDLIYHR